MNVSFKSKNLAKFIYINTNTKKMKSLANFY